jgi:hypothetical protein
MAVKKPEENTDTDIQINARGILISWKTIEKLSKPIVLTISHLVTAGTTWIFKPNLPTTLPDRLPPIERSHSR